MGLASAAVGARWYVIGDGAKAGALTYEMAEFAKAAYDMDVRYLGVCCGAGPHHIRALAEALGRRPSASRHSPDMARHSYYGTDAKITAKNRECAARL